MNRPLKFRAWHAKAQKMFSPEEMEEDQLTILPGTGRFINVHSTHTRLSQIISNEVMIPLQFTGLLDKYSNEIYEGDILGLNGIKQLWIVVFEDQAFRVKDADTGITQIGVLGECMSIMNEIIGNIYQSPELLEDK